MPRPIIECSDGISYDPSGYLSVRERVFLIRAYCHVVIRTTEATSTLGSQSAATGAGCPVRRREAIHRTYAGICLFS